jgi:hypothetical protein
LFFGLSFVFTVMNSTRTSTTSKAKAPKDGFLEMIKKILGSAPKKTTAPGKLSGRLSLPLLPPMDMAPKTPKKKTTVVKVEEKTVSGKPDSKKTTKVKQVVEKKVMKSSGADKPKMKGGCSSMYKGKGAGCTKGKIGGNFGYFF